MIELEQADNFEQTMRDKYPALFGPGFFGFEVGPGWYPIIDSLCAQIQSHATHYEKVRAFNLVNKNMVVDEVSPVVVTQVKEKFGGLRFYYDGGDEFVGGLVEMAESWAEHSCETCGKPGKMYTKGWMSVKCDDHAPKD